MANNAVISVTDKEGLDILVDGFGRHDYRILTTGGTAKRLREIEQNQKSGVEIIDIADYTQSPEMFDGRVKTLHPKIAGGILFDRNNEHHVAQAAEHGVEPINIVAVNLYAFEQTAAKPGITQEEIIEAMDIGGPTMMAAAIKNFASVAMVADPSAYEALIKNLDDNNGQTTLDMRKSLAGFAINRVADYRSANAVTLGEIFTGEQTLRPALRSGQKLGRYGENWHQQAWIYQLPNAEVASVAGAEQVHGTSLGYNNFLDADAALSIAKDFANADPTAVVVKHGNSCGIATSDTLDNALERAWQGDDVSAFGSIIAFNREVDLDTMKVITERKNDSGKKGWFVEVMVAPGYSAEALEYVKGKKSKEGLRLLAVGDLNTGQQGNGYRGIEGGVLVQTPDNQLYLASSIDEVFQDPHTLTCENSEKELTIGIVTERKPDESMKGLYGFAMTAAKHTKSNAIVIAREYAPGQYQVIGMGAGQPNRKDSGGLSIRKANDNLQQEFFIMTGEASERANQMLQSEYEALREAGKDMGTVGSVDYAREQLANNCVLASDAFFPFADGLEAVASFGVKNVIQPGGSNGDPSVIKAANNYEMAMVFTGMRHFKH